MLRHILGATVAAAAMLGATAAQAGTHWSVGIGINLPPADIVVTNGARYVEPAPVYYVPPPVVYAPAPRYVERDVYYVPPPTVVYETRYHERRWDDRRWDDRRWERERHEHRWDDGYGPRHGR